MASSSDLAFSKSLDIGLGHAVDRPFVHRLGSEAQVELDRGLVQVEHSPLHTTELAIGYNNHL